MSARAKLAILIPIVVMAVLPSTLVAFASSTNNVWDLRILGGPLVVCTGMGGPGGLPPCANLCDLVAQFIHIIYFVIAVFIWIVTPVMFAWGGLRFMMSRGSSEKVSGARKMLAGSAIGLLIVLAAYLIVSTFVTALGIMGVGGFGTATCSVQ